MKRGLDHFVYRELTAFAADGLAISLFPTKLARGLYNPEPGWRVHRWHPLVVLLLQPLFLIRAPARYLGLLREATRYRAFTDFVLAWYFASRMNDVDVLYATFGDHKLFIGYFCKRILQMPLVVTIHAYELYQNPNPELFVRALAACDQIVTVTEYNKELLAARYGVDAARIDVVRISVDTERYRPGNRFVVLIVAFFVEKKGHEVLFRAVKELANDDVEVWVVGGEGAGRPVVDVRALAAELGIASRVVFFGPLRGNALEAVYRACDVFCLPSRTDRNGVAEGFPTAIAEAMAFGKPVITTRHVEIPRILDEVLVDENDVSGLARAIDLLYRSPELRRRLGEKNRRLAEELFSTRNAAKTGRVLSGLAESSTRSAAVRPAAEGRADGAAQPAVGASDG